MIEIVSRAGYLFITPVPPGLSEELRFWEVVDVIQPFEFRDRETGEMVSATRRAGYKGQWSDLLSIQLGVGCCQRGLLRRVVNFLTLSGISFTYRDDNPLMPFHFGPDVVAPFHCKDGSFITMRPEQQRALLAILCEIGCGQEGAELGNGKLPPSAGSGGALISATMATGKTLIIAALCRCFPRAKILITSKKKSVVRRLVDGLTEYLKPIAHEIGEYHGGKKFERRITVCSEALLDSFDTSQVHVLIHDEVHNSSGQKIAVAVTSYVSAAKIGFSGTIERHKRLKFIEAMYGPIVDTISDAEAEELGRVAKVKVYVLKTHKGPDVSGKTELALERHGVTNNHRRNQLLAEVCCAIPEDVQTIIFVRTIEHIDLLIEKYLPPGFVVYHGQLKNKDRERIEKGLCSGEITRLIANDALSEGVDTTHVRVILEWGWSTTDQSVSQRGGRARRKAKGKGIGILVTPSDDWEISTPMEGVTKDNPMLDKRRARVSNYSKRGWEVIKVNDVSEIDFNEVNVEVVEDPEEQK